MDKTQFIYRYGRSVQVMRNDGTKYNTYMLYRMVSRDKGTMTDNFSLANEYMRGGVFRASDDIQNGYVITDNSNGEESFVIAHQPKEYFGVVQSQVAYLVLLDFPDSVTLAPSQADDDVARDKFGRPTSPLATKTVNVIVTKAELKIKPEVTGGKPTEELELYAHVGDVNENDEITWNGHTYRVDTVWPFGFASTSKIVQCNATRTVDVS